MVDSRKGRNVPRTKGQGTFLLVRFAAHAFEPALWADKNNESEGLDGTVEPFRGRFPQSDDRGRRDQQVGKVGMKVSAHPMSVRDIYEEWFERKTPDWLTYNRSVPDPRIPRCGGGRRTIQCRLMIILLQFRV